MIGAAENVILALSLTISLEVCLIAKCDSDALWMLPLDLYFPAIEGEAHENRTGRTGVEGL